MNTDKNNKGGMTFMDEHQAKKLLKSYGIRGAPEAVANNLEEAVEAAGMIGYPVVLKGAGKRLLHKTERGLVHLHLQDETAVKKAYSQIRDAGADDLEFVLVQKEIEGRREFMAGFYRDPQFGPVVLFGLGGIFAEALDDVCFRLAPLSGTDMEIMMESIDSSVLLKSFRGESPVNTDDIKKILGGLSRIAVERTDIVELDINPIKICPDGEPVAVDALILSEGENAGISKISKSRPAISPEVLGPIFHPKSVAFIGASASIQKWGYLLVVNTVAGGYKGDMYLVSPKGGTIAGRTVYRSLMDVPGPVDLAVVTIPAEHTLKLIEDCKKKGVERMVLVSSGFREAGNEGALLEEKLVKEARDAGIVILGPNTMGISNPHAKFFCTGSSTTPRAGGTAMVSQSGNLGTQLLAFAEQQNLAIRAFAGSGNEAMIAIEDYLDAFAQDKLTKTILLYIESVKDGRRFFECAKKLTGTKPVILLKGGQTPAGHIAAASHTGALVSDDRLFEAMCRQAGIIKVEQPLELLDLAAAFSSLPLPGGPRTAIMTWGGGWGVVTADLCHRHGLTVPKLDPSIIEEINGILPPYWSRVNPVDLVGDQDTTAPFKILDTLAAWDGCDAVLCLGIVGRRVFMKRFGRAVEQADPATDANKLNFVSAYLEQFEEKFIRHSAELMDKYQKPIIGVSLIPDRESSTIRNVDGSAYSAVMYEAPETAVKALAAMAGYRFRLKPDNHH